MVDNWQKSLRSRALPEEAMTGWNEGMTRLQQLAERLNRLDEQRGKYMTVSELKTEVFGIMQAFNRHIPAEEQLRRYDEVRNTHCRVRFRVPSWITDLVLDPEQVVYPDLFPGSI